MLSLCELINDSGPSICPDLPGDPPFEETILFLGTIFLAFWSGLAVVGWVRAKLKHSRPLHSRMVLTGVVFSAMCLVPMAYARLLIRERNFGRWADLKHDLSVIEEDARHYIAMNGPIDDEDKAVAFDELEQARGRNLSFTFGPGLTHVDIGYRWWWQLVTIRWARGRSAAFDLEAMECVADD